MLEDKEHIRVSLDDGAEFQVPQQDAFASFTAYLDAKYKSQIKEESQLRLDDTPESYLTRILALYPDKDQQTYLRGLYAITPAGIYAIDALQGFSNNQTLHPKILEIYPQELNQHLLGKGRSDKSLLYLRMNPTVSTEIIRSSNLAAYTLKAFGEKTVRERRQLVVAVALGKKKIEGAPLPIELIFGATQLAIKTAEKMTVGSKISEQLAQTEAEKLITIDSLHLETHSTAEVFQSISQEVGQNIKAIELFSRTLVPARLALDNMNIHPDVGEGLVNVFNRVIKGPPVAPQH